MTLSKQDKILQVFIAVVMIANIAFWYSVRHVQARWSNVPPAPEKIYASSYGLGDTNLSFRVNGLMIQNLGDTAGRYTSLKDYNYERLSDWFFLQDYLDPKSYFIPYLASYYFSGVQDPEKFEPALNYLEIVGERDGGQSWRWLVQAIFIARFRMNDLDRALVLAEKLAAANNPNVPGWVRQMPAFVMTAKGDKEAAYALLIEILKTNSADMHPNEIFDMKYRICNKLLDKASADKDPICEGIPRTTLPQDDEEH